MAIGLNLFMGTVAGKAVGLRCLGVWPVLAAQPDPPGSLAALADLPTVWVTSRTAWRRRLEDKSGQLWTPLNGQKVLSSCFYLLLKLPWPRENDATEHPRLSRPGPPGPQATGSEQPSKPQ